MALDMSHVAIFVRDGEDRLVRWSVDRDEVLPQRQIKVVFPDIFHERGDVFLDSEQHLTGIAEGHINRIQAPLPPPVVGRQIHGLLRCAGAFDGHGGLGEQGNAGFEFLNQTPSIGCQIETVVARDTILTQRFSQTIDGVPVKLQARTNDQTAIGQAGLILEQDRILVGFERGHTGPNPFHLARYHDRHRSGCFSGLESAASDQGPSRLIVMHICRIDDRDVQIACALQQRGRNRDTGRAPTHNNDVEMVLCG